DPSATPTASAASASSMAVAPPTGASDTNLTPGTPGRPGVDFSKLPAWAEGLDKNSVQSIFNSLDSSAKPTAAPSTTPTTNLGFPSAEPPGFQHVPYPEAPAAVGTLGAAAPAPAAAAAGPAAAPAEDPNAR